MTELGAGVLLIGFPIWLAIVVLLIIWIFKIRGPY